MATITTAEITRIPGAGFRIETPEGIRITCSARYSKARAHAGKFVIYFTDGTHTGPTASDDVWTLA